MLFKPTNIEGAFIIEPEPVGDERGFFARTFCAREFAAKNLEIGFVQSSVSFNRYAWTLRGLHYQSQPHPEVKLVSCRAGAIYDVIVDLRPKSPSVGRWFGVELSAENRMSIYVPADCAHGFMTVTENAEIHYQMTAFYDPALARGLRWDDPTIAVEWPRAPSVLSDRDKNLPNYSEAAATMCAIRTALSLD